MITLCKYKNFFGKPNEETHELRLCGLAFWDLFFTLFASLLFSYFFGSNYLFTFVILFLIGQLFHFIFCVDTQFMKWLYEYSQ